MKRTDTKFFEHYELYWTMRSPMQLPVFSSTFVILYHWCVVQIEVEIIGKKKSKSKSKNATVEVVVHDEDLFKHNIPQERIHRSHLVIWFDDSIDSNNDAYEKTMQLLKKSVPWVCFYDHLQTCVDYIERLDLDVSIISSGPISNDSLKQIHSCEQVYSIYFYRLNPMKYSKWERHLTKLKGNYDRLELICENLHHTTKQVYDSSPSFTLFDCEEIDQSNENVNRLEPSFMYIQILKNIILSMSDVNEKETRKDFIDHCREKYGDNSRILKGIDEFERDYQPDRSIYWYTRESFLFQILNRALRILQTDVILLMGFFIRDIHRQIEQLRQNQSYHDPFIVYRGQHLSKNHLERLMKTPRQLISFNSFLSTSRNCEISRLFAESAFKQENQVGILFQIKINPNECSTPYANISRLSYFSEEHEILFSMNMTFRLGAIQNLNEENRLFQIELKSTEEDDPDLRQVRQRIEKELGDGNPHELLGHLLIRMGQIDHAEQVYLKLLNKSSTREEMSIYYHQLGVIKDQQCRWDEAIESYHKSLQIENDNSEKNQLNIATRWNNIGSCYENMKLYQEALDNYKNALKIRRGVLEDEHPDLAQSYNNIATIYYRQKKYDPANFFYKKSLTIKEKTLPSCHPSLATSFNNIASIYFDIGKYDDAFKNFNKALSIRRKSLPSDHPEIAQTLNNLGMVHSKMKTYSKALSFYQEALQIHRNIYPSNHPSIGNSYRSIGLTWIHLHNYGKAVENLEKAVEILKESASSTDSSIENLLQLIEKNKEKDSRQIFDFGIFARNKFARNERRKCHWHLR